MRAGRARPYKDETQWVTKATNIIKSLYAAMAQQVEHVLGKDEVTGSNPVSSSIKKGNSFGLLFLIVLQPG